MTSVHVLPIEPWSDAAQTPIDRARLVERVNRLYHDWTADRFDDDHRQRHAVEAPFWRWVGNAALARDGSARPGRVILDVACGSGFVERQLRRFMNRQDRLIGVDLSPKTLASAATKRAASSAIAHICASGLRLPIANHAIDTVTINAAIHHVEKPAELLHELDRVLRPGGYLAIGFEPNVHYLSGSSRRRLGDSLDRLSWYAGPQSTIRRLQRLVASAGHDASTQDDTAVATRIARQLMVEGLTKTVLAPRAVLDLVDPHARGNDEIGLSFGALRASSLPHYDVVHLLRSDFLGASARAFRPLRSFADALGRAIDPVGGMLFSCLLRKREVAR